MAKKQKRNNDYYRKRLEKEHPQVHADFLTGRYKSLRQALLAAGLETERPRLSELKNAWTKANSRDRAAFIKFLASQGALLSGGPLLGAPTLTVSTSIASDRRLLKGTKERIEYIMKNRGLGAGELMKELGEDPHNQSLSGAIRNDTRVSDQLLQKLSTWLNYNRHI